MNAMNDKTRETELKKQYVELYKLIGKEQIAERRKKTNSSQKRKEN